MDSAGQSLPSVALALLHSDSSLSAALQLSHRLSYCLLPSPHCMDNRAAERIYEYDGSVLPVRCLASCGLDSSGRLRSLSAGRELTRHGAQTHFGFCLLVDRYGVGCSPRREVSEETQQALD
eukprot:scaffold3521_cov268-Ochromonas_danica.AAC.2